MNLLQLLTTNSILDASKGFDIGQFFQTIFSYVCLFIDNFVYFLVKNAFKLFLAISQFQIFSDTAFEDIINRTYLLIGVVSLFFVAYALLNAIINPDNASKGDKSITKIVKNIIIAIVGIAIVPTVFNWFYYFQSVVLCNNTIPKLILDRVSDDNSNVDNIATQFSSLLFESFFYPNALEESADSGNRINQKEIAATITLDGKNPFEEGADYTLADAYKYAEEGKNFWTTFRPFLLGNWPGDPIGSSHSVLSNEVQYLVILSTLAGGYCAYVLISLCIDMGLRAVKLGYLELIAPLAIMTNIIPGKDSVFKTWSKKTVSCALEVFVRLFVVVFAIYLVSMIRDMDIISFGSKICGMNLNFILVLLLKVLIYCSIFAFIKQAPKFFSEATGIKSDGFKIGLLDKMKENGMVQGLGAIGGGVTSGVRNFAANGGDNWQNAQNAWKNKNYGAAFKAAMKGVGGGISHPGSFVAGTASGLRIGWSNTKGAKKWSDIKEGAAKAADEAMEAKLKRDDYREKHKVNIPIIGGAVGSAIGHAGDVLNDVIKDYPNSHAANYNFQNKRHQSIDEILKAENAIDSQVKSLLESKKAKLEYDGETLLDIRNARDDADQAYNAAADALAQAKVDGDVGAIARATAALDNALDARTEARKKVIDAERAIKKDIRLGNVDDVIGYNEAGQLNQLYEKYYTALRNNNSSLSGDAEAYQHAKQVLENVSNVDDFRNNVETISRNINHVDVSFIDNAKHADAETLAKMNQENEAIRKQQEKK